MTSRFETSTLRKAALSAVAALVVLLFISAADAEKKHFGTLIRTRGEVTYQPAGAKTWHTASERMRIGEGDKLKTGPKGQAVVRLAKDNFLSLGPNAEITLNQSLVRSAKDPNSAFFGLFSASIEEYDLEVDLKKGQAVNVLDNLKGKSDYRVVTPIAVAGVRGTIFSADVKTSAEKPRALGAFADPVAVAQGSPGPQVDFAVLEGSVNISGAPGAPPLPPMTLLAGQSLTLGFAPPAGIDPGTPGGSPGGGGPSGGGPSGSPQPMSPSQSQNLTGAVVIIQQANTEASSDDPPTSLIREESVIQNQQENNAYNH